MEDARGFLLSELVRPISGDAEMAIAAKALLGPAVTQADPAQAEALAARLTRRKTGTTGLTLALLAVALVLLVWQGRRLIHDYAVLQPVYSWSYDLPDLPGDSHPDFAADIKSRMNTAAHAEVFGDPALTDPLEHALDHWRKHPHSAPLHLIYLQKFQAARGTYPEGLLETAEELDPENGIYHLILADQLASLAVGVRSDENAEGIPVYEIGDPAAYEEALHLIRMGVSKKQIRSHPDYPVHLDSLIPPPRTLAERWGWITHSAVTASSRRPTFFDLTKILATRGQQLQAAGNLHEYEELVETVDRILYSLATEPGTIMHGIVTHGTAGVALSELARFAPASMDPATIEAMEHRAQRLEEVARPHEFVREPADPRMIGGRPEMALSGIARHGFHNVPIPPLDINSAAFHSFVDRFLAWGWMLLLTLATCVLLLVGRLRSRVVSALSNSLVRSAGPADFLWLGAVGAAVPLLAYLIVIRFTPLGGRDFWPFWFHDTHPDRNFLLQPFFVQALAGLFLMFWMMSLAVHLRLRSHMGSVIPSEHSAVRWIGAPLSLSAIGAAGLTRYGDGIGWLLVALGLLLVPLLLVAAERLFRSPRGGIQNLRSAASHRLLATGTALGAVLAGLFGFAAAWEEGHWVANDPLYPGPGSPSTSAYEIALARHVREQTLEALGSSR